MSRDTLLDVFRTLETLRGEYLIYDDGFRPRSYTYPQVCRAARHLAARFEAASVGAGDKVILWAENRPEWVAAFWACILRGVAVTPIDEGHSPSFLRRVEQVVQPKLILVGEHVTLPDAATGTPVWPLSGIEWNDSSSPAVAPVTADTVAEILFTSGATSEPKGVVITHRNILANTVPVETEVHKYDRWRRPFDPIRFLNLLPLSHMFGQAMALFIPPMLSGVVVFQRSQNPHEIVRQIHARRISVLVSVPKILDVLREYLTHAAPEVLQPAPAGEKFWWRWWRYRRAHSLFGWKFWSFVVGGAALDPKLEEFFNGLGWLVIQGYGLTEAAPIVTLNHPFSARKGTVGKPIHGVEIKIAADGEVLVRGGNVTAGYFGNEAASAEAFEDGWLRTGDIGELDESGRLLIRGRKKEMIVLPDGRNVFPEDVERVLNELPGVRESAAVGTAQGGGERVHAVLVLEPGAQAEEVVRAANQKLEDHQRIAGFTVWEQDSLPRTEGTRKLKRREIRARISGEHSATTTTPQTSGLDALLSRYSAGRKWNASTTLDELGLSSLERVELMVALEQKLGVSVDETAFSQVRTLGDLEALQHDPARAAATGAREPFEFPSWNRHPIARWFRILNLNLWILPLARLFAWVRVEGRENLAGLEGPVLFAANHQSYFDTPVVFIALPWKWRHRLAPAMRKEFFDAHFNPGKYSWFHWFTNSLNYYLSTLCFNAFPIPQREAGARQTLRQIGEMTAEGYCPLIFPEGKHSHDDSLLPFQAGVAMIASRVKLPVVPVRMWGVNQVLHPTWKMARPNRVRVKIGKPVVLDGEDYAALAARLEAIMRSM